jgi:hypothetical protein
MHGRRISGGQASETEEGSMILTTTFIPTSSVYDLLCALWAEYKCMGNTRVFLMALRAELGKEEFARFEQDMLRLMNRHCAMRAVQQILLAAIQRAERNERLKQLRTIHQPA